MEKNDIWVVSENSPIEDLKEGLEVLKRNAGIRPCIILTEAQFKWIETAIKNLKGSS